MQCVCSITQYELESKHGAHENQIICFVCRWICFSYFKQTTDGGRERGRKREKNNDEEWVESSSKPMLLNGNACNSNSFTVGAREFQMIPPLFHYIYDD